MHKIRAAAIAAILVFTTPAAVGAWSLEPVGSRGTVNVARLAALCSHSHHHARACRHGAVAVAPWLTR